MPTLLNFGPTTGAGQRDSCVVLEDPEFVTERLATAAFAQFTDARDGQYIWTPSTSLPNGNNYALQIKQGNEINYFGPFVVQGASSSASASVSASPVPSAK